MDAAEVLGDLAAVGAHVEGGGGHESLRTGFDGVGDVLGDQRGGHVDDARGDRDPPGGLVDDGGHHRPPVVAGEERGLRGGAEGEEAVHAGVDEPVHLAAEAVGVDGEIVPERGDDGRDGTAELDRHGRLLGRWVHQT